MKIAKQNTGFLPNISAHLGIIREDSTHPMKRLDPMNPTCAFEEHARSSYSNKLCKDPSSFQSTLWNRLGLSQKCGMLAFFASNRGMQSKTTAKSDVIEH